MDTDKALELIRESIIGLLEDIATGTDPWISPEDLAEEQQITDEDVVEWLNKYKDMQFRLIVPKDEMDQFVEHIIDVLNSEWYREYYQSKVDEVRIGLEDQADWERTKKSLMPTWTPKR